MRKRIVITGMGVISPLGHTVGDMYQALLNGRSGVRPISGFNACRFPTQFAAEVRDFELGRYVRDPEVYASSGVNTQFALAAARQALDDAGLLDARGLNRGRMGVYLGSGEGVQDFHNLISMIA